jgi:hypothetical protein
MREIKVRFWLTEKKQMTSPYHIDCLLDGGWHDIGGHVTLQFTGLKDKNGKEIYEGDVIKSGHTFIVVWDEDEAAFGMQPLPLSGNDVILFVSWDADPIEVMGNIYENPDLL